MTVATRQVSADHELLLKVANCRADYAAELHFPVSSARPVLTYTYDSRERAMLPDKIESSQIGKTLSGRMVRVLQRSYGADMVLQRALNDLWGWCKRRHVRPDDGIPEPLHHERGLLCPRIVHEVLVYCNGSGEHGIEEAWLPGLRNAYYRRLIRRAAYLEDLEYEETEQFLAGALREMERKMTLWTVGAAS